MGINTKQLKDLVIVPTLKAMGALSDSAVNLLLGTCAQESQMGTYIKQVNGPALGIYQVEPDTHSDVWTNYLDYNPSLRVKIRSFGEPCENSLMTNLAYATAIARTLYLRVKAPLPAADDIEGLGRYYKSYYNTALGKATIEQFASNYARYVNA